MKATDLEHFMRSHDVANITLESMNSFSQSMSKEAVDEFCAAHPMYHATSGPGDIAISPFDYILAERVGAKEDLVGVRFHMVLKSELDAMEAVSNLYWHSKAR